MKVRGLQQQLAASVYLLPSQRDLLSRLLFQLAFNDFNKLAILGGSGSGKSTLAFALAELFSECQEMSVNVALLQAPMTTEQLIAQLAKQWFAAPQLSATELVARLAAEAAHTEWVLIVDDPEQLTEAQTDWLLQLTVRLFMFAGEAQGEMQLNLAIPALTLTDSEQLLQTEALDALSLAERFAHSQGDLHKLLAKESSVAKRPLTKVGDKRPQLVIVVAVLLVLLVGLFFWLNDDTSAEHSELAILTIEEPPLNIIDLPVMPDIVATELAITPEPESAALVLATETKSIVAESKKDPLLAEVPLSESIAEVGLAEITPADKSNEQLDEKHSQQQNVKVAAASEKSEPNVAVPATLPLAVYDHLTLLDFSANSLLVQLAVLSDEGALTRFKQSYPQLQILVYQRNWQGKEQWIIVSGPFTSNASARRHIQQLPGSLSASGPFIKTVGAVQQEIQTWQRLKLAKTTQGN